ncbi:MAG: DUF192 domain-containing protein [Patescibacteria group bacterium]
MKFIFTTVVIFISIGVLVYFAKYSVSMKAIPSLDEFIASNTAQLDSIQKDSVTDENSNPNQTGSVWYASSTIVKMILSDDNGSTTSGTSSITTSNTKDIIKKSIISVPSSTNSTSSTILLPVYTPKGKILVYTAKNPTTRRLGLSGYKSLAVDKGMLFIFPEAGKYDFWMKDMNFPLDIVWINSNKVIIGVGKNISPKTYPKSITSPKNIQFVLELNAGTAEIFGLATGTRVSF